MEKHVTWTLHLLPGPPYKEDLPVEKADTEDMLYAEENDEYKVYLTPDVYENRRVKQNNLINYNVDKIKSKESTNNNVEYTEDMFGQSIFDDFDFPSFNSFEINWLIISTELIKEGSSSNLLYY